MSAIVHRINIKKKRWCKEVCITLLYDRWQVGACDGHVKYEFIELMNDCIPKTILSKDGQNIQNIKVFFIFKYIIIY